MSRQYDLIPGEAFPSLENTQYALASTPPSPDSAEWMTFEQAKQWFAQGMEMPKGRKVYAKCMMCETIFTKSPGKFSDNPEVCLAQRHACSNRCAALLRGTEARQTSSCYECGESFAHAASRLRHKHIFCSIACSGAYRSKTFVGPAHHRYCAVELTCTQCLKVFTRGRFKARTERTKNPFCSHACYHESLRGVPTKKGSGRASLRSYPPEFKVLRRQLLRGASCVSCGLPAKDLHHRDGNPENNSVENLAPTCRSCHTLHHCSSAIPELSPSKI